MFLDQELLKICSESMPDTPEKVQQLNRDICKKCEEYWKGNTNDSTPAKQVKVVLDRTFNLFDSFVRMAKKSQDWKLRIIGDLYEENTYKKQLLANKEIADIYKKL